ncbi:Protein of unknown function [Cotesia congregata]|uniref:Uncharacterized protein n=1 Tax=Cotesia congregata TaxID=51543 RepID=A0A8J2H6T9_COTCN|nr:Protein of unknown function [Cotesia congregata]
MADGIVDPNSVRWVLGNGQDPEIGPSTVKLEFKIKSFNLDDIDLPDGYFVTGIYCHSREQIYVKDYKNSAEVTVENVEISHSGSNYVDLSVGVVSSRFNNLPVIPFFGSRSVVSNPPSPLGVLGLLYKGQPSYGGFFALKLIASRHSYDIYSDIIAFNNH